MYRLTIATIEPFVDGTMRPKIAANVQAYFDSTLLTEKLFVIEVANYNPAVPLADYVVQLAQTDRELCHAALADRKADLEQEVAVAASAIAAAMQLTAAVGALPITIDLPYEV
jgi:hypothetical protein